jgi:hypothetical protein
MALFPVVKSWTKVSPPETMIQTSLLLMAKEPFSILTVANSISICAFVIVM